ncbi:MAG: J domain-containing protein [Oscillospiraceae bacterium]|nr:J domain-containing protein [Oscillospiraceae bacterium]
MSDPYEILEINRSATDEEIKKAYRELAKKYHPDNFKDNPLSDLASEKMKSINEAYDQIQKEKAYNSTQNNNYYNYSNSDSSFPKIRELINNKRFSEAEFMLDAVDSNEKNAEWYYLKGVILTDRGWFFDAQKNFETACNLDPGNKEYRDAFNYIKNKSNNFYSNGGYNTQRQQNNSGCTGCDICAGLLCADCLCECFRCC